MRSAVMPCQRRKPKATRGVAARMHSHEAASSPSSGSVARNTPTAAAQAAAANAHCLRDMPKKTDSE